MSPEASELRRLRREVRKEPASLRFVNLAEHLHRAGETHEALEVLEEGLQHRPGLRSARVLRCRLLVAIGQVGEALAGTTELLAEDPDNVALASSHMDLLLESGERVRARVHLARLSQLGVDAERLQAWSDALGRLERAEHTGPSADPFLRPVVAERLLERGHKEAALRAWRRLAHDPEHGSEAESWLHRLERSLELPGRDQVMAELARERRPPPRPPAGLGPALRRLSRAWELLS